MAVTLCPEGLRNRTWLEVPLASTPLRASVRCAVNEIVAGALVVFTLVGVREKPARVGGSFRHRLGR